MLLKNRHAPQHRRSTLIVMFEKKDNSSDMIKNVPLYGTSSDNVTGQLHKGWNQTRTSPQDSNNIKYGS